MKYPYPNSVSVHYQPWQGRYKGRESRLTYTAKVGNVSVSFTGTYAEALDHFRNRYPSKTLRFIQDWERT